MLNQTGQLNRCLSVRIFPAQSQHKAMTFLFLNSTWQDYAVLL